MIKRLISKAKRFRRDENGTASIEFVMWFPIFLMTTYSGLEYGMLAYNHANLERALDEIIQDVRMNKIEKYDTSDDASWSHTLLKEQICKKAVAIPECFDNLSIEMQSINPMEDYVDSPAASVLNQDPLCLDTPQEIREPDDQIFEVGGANELMIIRVCVEVKPLIVGSTLSQQVRKHKTNGRYQLHAMSVFVHEPN